MTSRAALLAALLAVPALGVACGDKDPVGPVLSVSPEALDFGTVAVDGSDTQLLTLGNAGDEPFDLLSVSLSEGEAGAWGVDWEGSLSVNPGTFVIVAVTFAPEEEGPASGELLVRTSLSDPSRTVALSGTGGPSERDGDGDGYSPATGDCDDGRDDVFPGAEELCDGRDNDCDGSIPAEERDDDGDGYRVCADDCDDTEAARRPGAEEICDGLDNDCDGLVPDELDQDGDGYSLCDGDCDDAEPLAWPGNAEVCDFVDNDCSGAIDDLDGDGDGFGTCDNGRDCDDADPDVHPLLVDAAADGGGDGSAAAPYTDLASALAAVDPACPVVLVAAGSYAQELSWSDGELLIAGVEEDPSEVILTTPDDSSSRVLDVQAGGDVTVADLSIRWANAGSDGGAVRVTSARLAMAGVTLDSNSSAGDGGAIAVSSGSLALTDCTFLANVAADDGGAVALVSSSLAETGSVYQGNSGARGGAAVWQASEVQVRDSAMVGNSATSEGGALWVVGGALDVARLDLWQNAAGGAGGGLSIDDLADEDSVLQNLWVEANVAGGAGGGIAVGGSRSAFVVANSDLLANSAGGEGGGLYLGAGDATGTWAWSNLLAWNGGSSGLYAVDGGGASVAYTTAYSSTSGTDLSLGSGEDAGFNDADTDPRFTAYDPSDDPADQDLALRSDSPAIDSGPRNGDGPAAVPTWDDLDGSRNDRGLTGGQGAAP